MNLLMLAEVASQAAAGNTAAKKSLRELSEFYFQKAVVAHAESKGWKVHFAHYPAAQLESGKWVGTAQGGWPDLFCARGERAIAAELKAEGGSARPEQRKWLEVLGKVRGIETYLWKPRNAHAVMELLK